MSTDLGDEERFRVLVDEVGEPVRRYVVRRVGSQSSEDVLADVLLVLWRRLHDLPDDAALPWAYAVARNCVANWARGERRRTQLQAKAVREVAAPWPDEDEDEATEWIHHAVTQLPETDREIVRLWAWEGLAPREIGTVMEMTPNAVSIRLHRAKRRLRELLGERNEPLPDTD